MTTKMNIALLVSIVFVWGLWGCAPPVSRPLTVGTNLWTGYEPLYLARQQAYWSEQEVALIEMPSASDVMRAFRNRMLDCAALTLDETYLLLQDGFEVKILLVMDISHGADVIVGQPEIKSLSDLVDKRIAVENSAVGAYMLVRALGMAHIDPSNIHVVSKTISGHQQAYLSKEVDAVVTFEPVKTKLLNAGANLLFSSSQIPNEIFDVLVVHADVLNTKPQLIKLLTDGWYKSLQYLKSNSQQAVNFSGKRLGIGADGFRLSLQSIKLPTRAENNSILKGTFLQSAYRIEQFMLQNRLLSKQVNPQRLLLDLK